MTKRNKIGLILLLSIILIFSAFSSVIISNVKLYTADAQNVMLENSQINDNYAINNKTIFPLTVNVDYDGKNYTTSKGIVYSPSGDLIEVNSNGILLNETGKYQIKYLFKTDDGKYINAVKDFTVTDDLYSFTVENGSSFTVATQSEQLPMNNDSDIMFSREDGLIARINNGSSFIYNKPIDLSDCGDEDTAEIIKLDARLVDVAYDETNKKYKTTEAVAKSLKIKLMDCYNSMNGIEIIIDEISSSIWFRVKTMVSTKSYGISYVFPTTSQANNNSTELYVDDLRGIAHINDWGTYFTGYGFGDSRTNLLGYTLTYDYKLNRIYYEYNDTRYLICDLMNTALFGEGEFTPFTTGEVYLSMTGSGYNTTDSVRVDILSIGGEKITENKKLHDTTAPKLDIDVSFTENNVVYIAKGERFIIPEAKVVDINYKDNLDVNVYRNYGNEMQTTVCSNKESFIADVEDNYSVVYTARDSFGNVASEIINVVVINAKKSLDLRTEKLDVAYFGEENVLPSYNVVTINDFNKVFVTITAENGDEKVEIDSDSRIFKPKKLGTYKICYKYSDNLFTSEYSYEVNVQARKDVVFLDNVSFYDYVIKNAEYKISPVSAYINSNNMYIPVDAECYVSFDKNDFIKVTNINKLKIEAEETIDIKFVYQGVSSNVYSSQVVDVGFGVPESYKLSKYFVGDFEVYEYDANGKKINNIAFQSNVDTGANTLKFINPIDYTQFRLEYRTPLDKANYERLNIKLTDINNRDKTFTISIRKSGDAAFISVNGGKEYLSSKKFAGEFVNIITYYGDLGVLNVNGLKFYVDLGFSDIFAYIDVEMEGIYGETGFTVVKLNNAIFDNAVKKESSQPLVNLDEAYGQYEIDNVVNIKTPVFSDVLTPINYETIKFTVITPEQNYAKTVDGVILDGSQAWAESYDVMLSQFGLYTVTYYGQDYLNNKASSQYRFEVKDKDAPQIVIEGNYSETEPMRAKVGKVNIQYEINDNINAQSELTVIINLMNNRTMVIDRNVGSSFSVSEKGEYTVFVYALDKDGNSACTSFKMIIE